MIGTESLIKSHIKVKQKHLMGEIVYYSDYGKLYFEHVKFSHKMYQYTEKMI